jgi:hypothetical protein
MVCVHQHLDVVAFVGTAMLFLLQAGTVQGLSQCNFYAPFEAYAALSQRPTKVCSRSHLLCNPELLKSKGPAAGGASTNNWTVTSTAVAATA